MKVFTVIIIGLCLIGAIAGYHYGYRSKSEAAASTEARSSSTALAKRPPREQQASHPRPNELIDIFLSAIEKRDRERFEKAWGSIERYSSEELRELFGLLSEIKDPDLREDLYQELMEVWAGVDREDALQHALTLNLKNERRDALQGIFRGLAQLNPAEAFDFWKSVRSRIDFNDHQGILRHVFREWGKRDLASGFEAFRELAKSGRGDYLHMMQDVLNELIVFDFRDEQLREQGIALIDTLPDEELRTFGLSRILLRWSALQPLESMGAWIDHRDTASTKEQAILERAAAAPHISRDPQAAAQWLMERATPESLPGHLEKVVSVWARTHPNACAEWLGVLDLGKHTDLAVSKFSSTIARDDHATALQWSQKIVDDSLRQDTMKEAFWRWQRLDPEAALQFLNESDLSSEERQSLLKSGH